MLVVVCGLTILVTFLGCCGAIRENRAPMVDARDVFRVLDICLACWDSVESRRTVDVAYML